MFCMSRLTYFRQFAAVVAVGFCFFILGCNAGNRGVPVEGNVTVAGKPVDDGSINFVPDDGQGPTAGARIENGHFRFAADKGVVPGKKNVRITAAMKTGKKVPAGLGHARGDTVDEVVPVTGSESCEIVAGKPNQFDFDIKAKPK
jgi:hypothetical protein